MKKLLNTPFIFIFTGFTILVVGLIFFQSTLDINLHDTYFVIAHVHIALYLCLLFLAFSLIYFIFNKLKKPLNKSLAIIHYIFTILTIILLVFSSTDSYNHIKRYTGDNPFDSEFSIKPFILFLSLTFIIAQIIFIFNIVWTLLKKKK